MMRQGESKNTSESAFSRVRMPSTLSRTLLYSPRRTGHRARESLAVAPLPGLCWLTTIELTCWNPGARRQRKEMELTVRLYPRCC